MLSRHSMHVDAARYIAYSGEFVVRCVETKGRADDSEAERDAQADADGDKDNNHETRPTKAIEKARRHPPSDYELNEANLGGPSGLGKITPMDGFDESLKEMKKRRAEAKQKVKSRSGDEGEKSRPMVQLRRGSSVSSAQADAAGPGRASMSSEVKRIVAEGTENARKQTDRASDEGKERQGGQGPTSNGHVPAGNGSTNGAAPSGIDPGKEKLEELRQGTVQVLSTK